MFHALRHAFPPLRLVRYLFLLPILTVLAACDDQRAPDAAIVAAGSAAEKLEEVEGEVEVIAEAIKSSPPCPSADISCFDWPPPKASAEVTIPDKWLRGGRDTKLADVAKMFEAALSRAEYGERSYYWVPRGFALATQLEQIASDGTPLPGRDRWRMGLPSVGNLSLLSFIQALARAPAGYYRSIVFVVTDEAWGKPAPAPEDEWIKRVAQDGAHDLPPKIGGLPYGEKYQARALIYEFRKKPSAPAETLLPSSVPGETHLEKSRLWKYLSIL